MAIVTNQTNMTGPKAAPIFPVPCRWTMNKPTKMTSAIGTTHEVKPGSTSSRPSTADSTDTAGVIIPSP